MDLIHMTPEQKIEQIKDLLDFWYKAKANDCKDQDGSKVFPSMVLDDILDIVNNF